MSKWPENKSHFNRWLESVVRESANHKGRGIIPEQSKTNIKVKSGILYCNMHKNLTWSIKPWKLQRKNLTEAQIIFQFTQLVPLVQRSFTRDLIINSVKKADKHRMVCYWWSHISRSCFSFLIWSRYGWRYMVS